MADGEDPFESLLFLEERCHADGYYQGWNNGHRKGLLAGQSLGIDKGKEIGSEIGYYAGFVATWILLIDESEKKGTRIKNLLQNLNSMIGNQLQLTDASDEYLFSHLDKVRAKFKQVCSLLGVCPEGKIQEGVFSF